MSAKDVASHTIPKRDLLTLSGEEMSRLRLIHKDAWVLLKPRVQLDRYWMTQQRDIYHAYQGRKNPLCQHQLIDFRRLESSPSGLQLQQYFTYLSRLVQMITQAIHFSED